MKLWDDLREWWTNRDPILAAMQAQRENDALIAESFAKQGKGAQGVQRAMAVRIANAIRKGAA